MATRKRRTSKNKNKVRRRYKVTRMLKPGVTAFNNNNKKIQVIYYKKRKAIRNNLGLTTVGQINKYIRDRKPYIGQKYQYLIEKPENMIGKRVRTSLKKMKKISKKAKKKFSKYRQRLRERLGKSKVYTRNQAAQKYRNNYIAKYGNHHFRPGTNSSTQETKKSKRQIRHEQKEAEKLARLERKAKIQQLLEPKNNRFLTLEEAQKKFGAKSNSIDSFNPNNLQKPYARSVNFLKNPSKNQPDIKNLSPEKISIDISDFKFKVSLFIKDTDIFEDEQSTMNHFEKMVEIITLSDQLIQMIKENNLVNEFLTDLKEMSSLMKKVINHYFRKYPRLRHTKMYSSLQKQVNKIKNSVHELEPEHKFSSSNNFVPGNQGVTENNINNHFNYRNIGNINTSFSEGEREEGKEEHVSNLPIKIPSIDLVNELSSNQPVISTPSKPESKNQSRKSLDISHRALPVIELSPKTGLKKASKNVNENTQTKTVKNIVKMFNHPQSTNQKKTRKSRSRSNSARLNKRTKLQNILGRLREAGFKNQIKTR